MQTYDVLTFGEAMVMFMADQMGELHQVEHFTRELAGAETNVAIGLARLGYDVAWISKVGNDAFGRYIMEKLQSEHVHTNYVKIDPAYPTGFQFKSKIMTGDPDVLYFRKGSAASTLSVQDAILLSQVSARHLHMTGIPLAISDSARAFAEAVMQQWKREQTKTQTKTISFDPNLRPSLWNSEKEMVDVVNSFAVQADWVFPGVAEGEILTGYKDPYDIAAFYLDKGVRLVVVKVGAKGAYWRTATAEAFVPGYQIPQVVDTVGAGDGFATGVISGLLDNMEVTDAVARGNAIGAMAVMAKGDSEGLPSRVQLETFMKNGKRSA